MRSVEEKHRVPPLQVDPLSVSARQAVQHDGARRPTLQVPVPEHPIPGEAR